MPPPRSVLGVDSDALKDVKTKVSAANADAKVAQLDFVGEGTVTAQTEKGPVNYSVLVLRSAQGQNVFVKAASEKTWTTDPKKLDVVEWRILDFVQTQNAHGVSNFLKATDRKADVLDAGSKEGTNLVVVRETDGAATRYSIDAATSRVTRIDLQRGRSTDASGKLLPNLESYTFSDFRSVNGQTAPYKLEHYTNGVKQEELQFTTIRYTPANHDPKIEPGKRGAAQK
jgi:hypothetical protein